MEYIIKARVKSDLWPDEIKASIEEAVEIECGHTIELLGCWVDEE